MKSHFPLQINVANYEGDFMYIFCNTWVFGACFSQHKEIHEKLISTKLTCVVDSMHPIPLYMLQKTCIKFLKN